MGDAPVSAVDPLLSEGTSFGHLSAVVATCVSTLIFPWPWRSLGEIKKFCLSVGTGSGRAPTAWPQVCVSFRKSGMLSAGRKAGRRLVSSETPCICSGISWRCWSRPWLKLAPGRQLFFRGSLAFRLVKVCLSGHCFAKGSVFDTPGGHSEDAKYCPNAHFTDPGHGTSVEIRVVLSMPRFYCEEQSLEGIICWLVVTSVVYCLHVKHTFEDYITQQTYVQQCNAQSAVLLHCGLHLDSTLSICLSI